MGELCHGVRLGQGSDGHSARPRSMNISTIRAEMGIVPEREHCTDYAPIALRILLAHVRAPGVPKMADVVVIDFETANERRGSPCAVGYAVVMGLQMSDGGSFLTRPPEFRFEEFNVSLHGITPDSCRNAPVWPAALQRLTGIIGEMLVMAHYTPFDIGVIRDACAFTGTECPELHFAAPGSSPAPCGPNWGPTVCPTLLP